MSVYLNINGEIDVRDVGSCSEAELKNLIAEIKDGWDERAFTIWAGWLEEGCPFTLTLSEEVNGSTPVNDGIIVPLNALCSLAKEKGFSLDGYIETSSDCSDADGLAFIIKGNSYKCMPAAIYNASDEELIEELTSRGYVCRKEEVSV